MVLTAAQQQTLFTDPDHLGLSNNAADLLIDEGLATIQSLHMGTKDFWDNFFAEMQKSRLVEITPAANGNPAVFQSQPRPRITAASQDRLRRASVAVKYYDMVGRELTMPLMTMAMIDIIYEHVERLKRSATTELDHPVPVMGNGSNFQKFLQAFQQFLKVKIGSMIIPVKLAWIIRPDVNVPAAGPLVQVGVATFRPWSREHGSFDTELIARVSHAVIGYDMDEPTFIYGDNQSVLAK